MEDKKPNNATPPRWAQRLLEWYCKPELLEDLQGDLNEYFERNLKSKGARRARLVYIIDVFKFLRLYTLRKPEFLNLFIQWIMIGSYIKTSGRSILRNKLFSTINIAGLAISMSVGLILIALLIDMNSYDTFHQNRSRIYRVISQYSYQGHPDNNFYASSSLRTGKAIQESIPGIEGIAILRNDFSGDIKLGETTVPLSGLWANEKIFNVFTFPLIQGDPSTALKNPFSVVLTEESARKLVGFGDALGKTVLLKDKEYVVTGIMKDIPRFSHMKFDMLGSLSTREITEKENKKEMAWDNMWYAYTYLLLPEDANVESLQTNLNALSSREDKAIENTSIKLALQPLSEIALGDDLNNSIGPVMGKGDIWMIGVLSIVVIISACFNYTNLSIARSLRRSREVGIRKVVGALKSHVVGQFVVEAVLISLIALIFSFGIFILLKPYFLSNSPKLQRMLQLDLSPQLVGYFILMAVTIGLMAGLLPAVFYSRINAVQVLKSSSTLKVFRHVNFRKVLLVIQYSVSLMFITATFIGMKQYNYFLSFDLGYDTENIFNIKLQSTKPNLLIKELSELPEVKGISQSEMITSVGGYWGTFMKYVDPTDSSWVNYNGIDENYIPLHNHVLLAGRNFTALSEQSKESEVIVNEKVLKRFGIADGDPAKALDEIVTVDRKQMKIIGVMKDYQYGRAGEETQETIFRYRKNQAQYINAKIKTTDWPAALAKIEMAWHKVDNVHPLEAKFYDDQIEQSYGEIAAMLKIIGFLAFLAICISSMGLFGMVVFSTETRLREISIRKVLGAGEGKLIYLLSKGFLFLLMVAAAIALPSTYLFFDQVVMQEFANHATISLADLMIGTGLVMMIAFLMIGMQTLKVARTNPADVLKNE